MDLTSKTNKEIASFLASRIRSERSRCQYSQAKMAKESGIPLRTYKRIELTGTGTIENLIVILRTFGRVRAVELLFPIPLAPRPSIIERIQAIADEVQIDTKNG